MTKYKVKSWPQYFRPIVEGSKKHDMRDMDEREYSVGDVLTLQEYDPFGGGYTGYEQDVKVTYITSRETPCAFSSAMLDRRGCILSFERVGKMRFTSIEL